MTLTRLAPIDEEYTNQIGIGLRFLRFEKLVISQPISVEHTGAAANEKS